MNVVQSAEPAPIDTLSRVGLYNRIGSGSGVGATVGEVMNASGSFLGLRRMEAAAEARLGTPTRAGTYIQVPGTSGYSRLLTQAEAEERYGVNGFLDFADYPNGIREGEARIWHDAAVARATRADVLSRADNGLLARRTRDAAALLATALDPVNLGLSLVPGVGELRYAWLAERLGAPLARFTAGAIDGAVGNALVEPLALLQARSEQLDYSAYDSLKSILLGGALGGGLHLMFGRAPTAAVLDDLTQGQREDLMRGALDDVEQGRVPDVGQVIKAEQERMQLGDAYDRVLTQPVGPKDDPLVAIEPKDIEAVVISRGGWKGRGDVEVKGSGFGLVKFIWRHGEKSAKDATEQVTREDVLAFPSIIRRKETLLSQDADGRTWLARRPDGRVVLYGDRSVRQEGGLRRLVTMHMIRNDDELDKVLTRPGSPGRDFAVPPRDTAPTPYDQPSVGQDAGPPGRDFAVPSRDTAPRPYDQPSAGQGAKDIGPSAPDFNQPVEELISTGSNTEAASTSAVPASRAEEAGAAGADDPLAAALRDTIARKRSPDVDPLDATISAKADESLTAGLPSAVEEQVAALEQDLGMHQSQAEASPPDGGVSPLRDAVQAAAGDDSGGSGVHDHSTPPEPEFVQFSWIQGRRYTTNKTLRKEWEKQHGKRWPRDFLGRNLDVQHKIALADGGTDHVSNIEPMERNAHMLHHLLSGDFARWAKRKVSWRRAEERDLEWTPLRNESESI